MSTIIDFIVLNTVVLLQMYMNGDYATKFLAAIKGERSSVLKTC